MKNKLKQITINIFGKIYFYLKTGSLSYELDKLVKSGAVTVSRHSYGKPSVYWYKNDAKLFIGNFTSIAKNVSIHLGGIHPLDWVSTFPFRIIWDLPGAYQDGTPATKGDIKIGSDVWIGFGVTIVSGITIGDGAALLPHSMITKDVPPYAVVGGNPAKVIKKRFPDDIIEELLKIKWWNWDDEKINKFTPLLCNENIDDFIKAALEI